MRQLSARTNINPASLKHFKDMSRRFISYIQDNMKIEGVENFDPYEWLYAKDNFTMNKKHKYDQVITEQKRNLIGYCSPFIARVKSSEVYHHKCTFDRNEHIMTDKRPRLI